MEKLNNLRKRLDFSHDIGQLLVGEWREQQKLRQRRGSQCSLFHIFLHISTKIVNLNQFSDLSPTFINFPRFSRSKADTADAADAPVAAAPSGARATTFEEVKPGGSGEARRGKPIQAIHFDGEIWGKNGEKPRQF